MIYLVNAFSISMISQFDKCKVYVRKINRETAKDILQNNDFISAVGHEGTAKVLSSLLGIKVESNRKFIQLNHGDKAIVAQINARLPEGKVLSEEELREYIDKIIWFEVFVSEPNTCPYCSYEWDDGWYCPQCGAS